MSLYEKGSPHIQHVNAGETVYICRCGKTSNPLFCDGSHKGKSHTPLMHTADSRGDIYVCGCGKAGNLPWCDGSHNK